MPATWPASKSMTPFRLPRSWERRCSSTRRSASPPGSSSRWHAVVGRARRASRGPCVHHRDVRELCGGRGRNGSLVVGVSGRNGLSRGRGCRRRGACGGGPVAALAIHSPRAVSRRFVRGRGGDVGGSQRPVPLGTPVAARYVRRTIHTAQGRYLYGERGRAVCRGVGKRRLRRVPGHGPQRRSRGASSRAVSGARGPCSWQAPADWAWRPELGKFPQIERVTWLHFDPAYPRALLDALPQRLTVGTAKLEVPEADMRTFLAGAGARFDLIIINLPDVTTLTLNRYCTREFFALAKQALTDTGRGVGTAGLGGRQLPWRRVGVPGRLDADDARGRIRTRDAQTRRRKLVRCVGRAGTRRGRRRVVRTFRRDSGGLGGLSARGPAAGLSRRPHRVPDEGLRGGYRESRRRDSAEQRRPTQGPALQPRVDAAPTSRPVRRRRLGRLSAERYLGLCPAAGCLRCPADGVPPPDTRGGPESAPVRRAIPRVLDRTGRYGAQCRAPVSVSGALRHVISSYRTRGGAVHARSLRGRGGHGTHPRSPRWRAGLSPAGFRCRPGVAGVRGGMGGESCGGASSSPGSSGRAAFSRGRTFPWRRGGCNGLGARPGPPVRRSKCSIMPAVLWAPR